MMREGRHQRGSILLVEKDPDEMVTDHNIGGRGTITSLTDW